MKSTADVHWREYPHAVEFRTGVNARHAIFLANEENPLAEWALYGFVDPRLLDATGTLTSIGRSIVLDGMIRETRGTPRTFCIVWGARDCTFLMPDGTTCEGRKPPRGAPMEPESYSGTPADLVDCRYVELPPGSAASHACIVRLTRDRVEIASGTPCVLGCYTEPTPPGRTDPFEGMLDENGMLHPPARFRGQPVTGVTEDHILGPVQPDGAVSFVVEPWPDQVFDACRRIAGRDLPREILDAAWRAVDPIRWDVLQVGIRLAA